MYEIAPRVRAFAELALHELRSGVGGDASLLADKQAFSEFMDRVNERYVPSTGVLFGMICRREYSQRHHNLNNNNNGRSCILVRLVVACRM